MEKLTKEQIEKAVNWWGAVVGDPKFQHVRPGEAGPTEVMGMMLGKLNSHEITPELAEKFKAALREVLSEQFNGLWMNVDYGPDQFLGHAAQVSGLPLSNFPWKTSMSFHDGKVEVSYGYGQPYVEI